VLAHSKTSAETKLLQARPLVPSSFFGESSSSPFFQALKLLMNEIFDHERLSVRAAPQYCFSEVRTYRFFLTRPR
jgi:hypothetical protein